MMALSDRNVGKRKNKKSKLWNHKIGLKDMYTKCFIETNNDILKF